MKGTRFANFITISKNYTSPCTSWFTHIIFLKHISPKRIYWYTKIFKQVVLSNRTDMKCLTIKLFA